MVKKSVNKQDEIIRPDSMSRADVLRDQSVIRGRVKHDVSDELIPIDVEVLQSNFEKLAARFAAIEKTSKTSYDQIAVLKVEKKQSDSEIQVLKSGSAQSKSDFQKLKSDFETFKIRVK